MTTTTAPSVQSPSSRAGLLGTSSVVVAAVCTTLFAHDWGEVLFSVVLMAIVGAVIFVVVVPRALRKPTAGGTALGLAVPAFLLVLPAFWSGLPLILGVAGLVVGNHGRMASSGARKCIAAVVLGSLAVLGYVAIYVLSGVAGETGFLLD